MIRFLRAFALLPLLSPTVRAQTEEFVQLRSAGLTLNGTLTMPVAATRPVPVVLLIAGSGPTDRHGNNAVPAGQLNSVKAGSYRMLAGSLANLGVAVLCYDKRGVGSSIPARMTEASLTFDAFVEDAVGWINQLRADKRFSKVDVLGHSEGALVGMIAARRASADAFVSLAGSGSNISDMLKAQLGRQLPDSLRQEVVDALDSLKAGHALSRLPTPYPQVRQLFRPGVQPYLISWMKYDPAVELRLLTVPVLIVQGRRDVQVSVTDAERLKAARPDAQLTLSEAMNHACKDVQTNSLQEAMASYNDPGQPLTPGLASAIAQFVKKP